MMKRIIALLLACCVLVSTAPLSAEVPFTLGVLTLLNTTESKFSKYGEDSFYANNYLADKGFLKFSEAFYNGSDFVVSYHFYDDLNSMILALKSGKINRLVCPQTTAKYVASHESNIAILFDFDTERERTPFIENLLYFHVWGYSFLLREDNQELCNEFNKAIAELKADGTLRRLIHEQINDAIDNKEIQPVEIAKIDGAETIRVAVTGSLPPMDYAAPDGTPAGFSTAVLSEISKRIGKNIELVMVDSVGRSAALSSGRVDAAFWATSPMITYEHYDITKDEMTEEQAKIVAELKNNFNVEGYKTVDIPAGTIITEPYYVDYLVSLYLKAED